MSGHMCSLLFEHKHGTKRHLGQGDALAEHYPIVAFPSSGNCVQVDFIGEPNTGTSVLTSVDYKNGVSTNFFIDIEMCPLYQCWLST